MGGSNANKASKDGFGHAVYVYTYGYDAAGFNDSRLLNTGTNVFKDGTVTSYP
jgi:hypothetical protein